MYFDDTWSQAFSIRVTGDTVYLRQHFSSNRYSTVDTLPKENVSYTSTMPTNVSVTLDSFLQHIDFTRYDTAYVDTNLQDGVTYSLYIHTDSLAKTIHIYGDNAPNELLFFGRWIASVKNTQLQFVETNRSISFDHATDRLPPPVKVDLRRLTPPTN